MLKLISTSCSDITFAPGKYLITDLCYVYPEQEWGEYCKLVFKDNPRGVDDNGAIFSYNNINFFCSHTAHGDGYFPIERNSRNIGACSVDAGCLALIPMELLKLWNADFSNLIERKLSVLVEVNKKFEIESGDGNWSFLDVEVITDDDMDEECQQPLP